jgi:hypothetical protein
MVGPSEAAILNQESNHVQVRRCHTSLFGRSGFVLGSGASSMLPQQVFVLCSRTDMLRPRAELLRSGPC